MMTHKNSRLVELEKQALLFLNKVENALFKYQVQFKPHWDIDHLCYRTTTPEQYLQLKTEFQSFSTLLTESEVNGRPISTFKLPEPISYQGWRIDLLELPAPKPNKLTIEGFEHIEIVCDETFNELTQLFLNNPLIKIDLSGLAKTHNQELEISLDGINLKFHHCSLESVVNLETNKKVWKAIQQSSVLQLFNEFEPLIAGTFPLGIETASSDVDILINLNNRKNFRHLCKQHLEVFDNYQLEEITNVDGLPTILVNFIFNDVPFELFAQACPSVQQRAYRHYLIEERLLKLGGLPFKKLVQDYRRKGLKTEPAFAKALNLIGDSYIELLELQKQSNAQLTQRLLQTTFSNK